MSAGVLLATSIIRSGKRNVDPASKFVLAHVQGRCDKELIRQLYEDENKRLFNKHSIALFSDGYSSYASLFPEFFGIPYQQHKYGRGGRNPKEKYRTTKPAPQPLSGAMPRLA